DDGPGERGDAHRVEGGRGSLARSERPLTERYWVFLLVIRRRGATRRRGGRGSLARRDLENGQALAEDFVFLLAGIVIRQRHLTEVELARLGDAESDFDGARAFELAVLNFGLASGHWFLPLPAGTLRELDAGRQVPGAADLDREARGVPFGQAGR